MSASRERQNDTPENARDDVVVVVVVKRGKSIITLPKRSYKCVCVSICFRSWNDVEKNTSHADSLLHTHFVASMALQKHKASYI